MSLIDGKAIAADILAGLAEKIAAGKPTPGLALVQVGDDPASAGYLKAKHRRAVETGIAVFAHHVAAAADLRGLIRRLNGDASVHGILVQLPLPEGFDERAAIEDIDPAKDVDGLHPFNLGRLAGGGDALVACTPAGCLELIKRVTPSLAGRHAVVLGRSRLVGAPMAQLLLRENATVTVLHTHSRHPAEQCRQADIVVSATGQPGLVRGDWIKPGATVIDVGNTRTTAGLVGDVAFAEAVAVAGAITPVPGGVGPMTIAMLMRNVVLARDRQEQS
jgi:methylenetetrahydrofolate dehydrogenase (NADP+)/methenyltetrahydrofolate cyclohydrolase